jgi:hypothetical protein
LDEIADDAEVLANLPRELKNKEFYQKAYESNPSSTDYLDEEFLAVWMCIERARDDIQVIDDPRPQFQKLVEKLYEKGVYFNDLSDDYDGDGCDIL